MIDQTDSVLQAWIKSVVEGIDVILGSPIQLAGKRGVSVYLLALAEPPSAWVNRPARAALRYLITTWSEDEKEAHNFLGRLLTAALEKPEYELDLTEIPIALWTALGISPRPAFILCVPFAGKLPEPTPRLVQGPLVIQGSPITSLYGIVLGPGDVPIAGAGVELPALQLRGHTDTKGRFRFSTVPGEPKGMQLIVRARGYVQKLTIEHASSEKEPLEIRFVSLDAK